MVAFYKILKKYNEIQLTENKMALNNRKMKTHSPFPARIDNKTNFAMFKNIPYRHNYFLID